MDISVIIPLFNEEESLPELSQWIKRVMNENNFSYEVIFVDDGSTDNSWSVINQIIEEDNNFKGIKFLRNYGKSAALNIGFKNAQGEIIITMDADLQDSPDEIPELHRMLTQDGFDMVSGWKQKRYDPLSKTLPTKLFNATARKISKVKLHDFNCGLKAYKKKVVKNIEVYGEMHRYIPIIAKWTGFDNIGEKVVKHQARKYGKTKFGLNRFINGFLDLLSLTFVSKFKKRPMHFFGTIGLLFFLIGGFITIWLIAEKLICVFYETQITREITQQPLFFISLTSIIIGCQLFIAGYLSEMISQNSTEKNPYIIDEYKNIK